MNENQPIVHLDQSPQTPDYEGLANLTRFLTELSGVPKEVRERYFGALNIVLQLSNIREKDVPYVRMMFEDILCTIHMNQSDFEASFDEEEIEAQIRILFEMMIKRSVDGFERKQISTERKQIEMIGERRGGIFSRILGR